MKNGEKNVLTAYPFDHMNETSGISVGCASSKMVDYIGGPEKADKFMRTLYTSPIDGRAAW